ncbi:MAG: class I SAM-dependent methyltransferase [Alphaproteobacteria bacterium]|nr:class I SAM-dependent methyltransferase [Alphaproteobacteria bacterium]MCL2504876.1 class I SAM-dependent methyltransferase [Alphaproteobacteria bacterium]
MKKKTKNVKKNPESVWFGKERVTPDKKTALVDGVFSSVAKNYDIMNDLMSIGMHRIWKNIFVSDICASMNASAKKIKVLDLAGGTADIAIKLYGMSMAKAAVTVCDINEQMLEYGKAKVVNSGILSGIDFVLGNAEKLRFEDCSFDYVVISFGIRNVARIDTALSDIFRVLKPGGQFFCLEFSSGVDPKFKYGYDLYCDVVLPFLGTHVAKDREAYEYLAKSIQSFPNQESFAKRISKAGFSDVKWKNLFSGIAVEHYGIKKCK